MEFEEQIAKSYQISGSSRIIFEIQGWHVMFLSVYKGDMSCMCV